MAKKNFLSSSIIYLFKKFLSVEPIKSKNFGDVRKILIIRQHNQLGDVLAGVSLLRAVKEKYPNSHITIILSKVNYQGLIKNKFIDRSFVFDKSKLLRPGYYKSLKSILRDNYDLCIVPVTVSISFTSNLLARLSKSIFRLGPASLDGKKNDSYFLFNQLVDIDWRKHPDSHVADRILDIVRPFGIDTNNFTSDINFDERDLKVSENFISSILQNSNEKLIGIHPGAGKPQNRWPLEKFIELISFLSKNQNVKLFLTASSADDEELKYLNSKCEQKLPVFKNHSIAEVAALLSKADLFITNDTGTMHIAGATNCKQISLFGPTNPYNWAPIGKNKAFIKKSEFMDDISVNEVFDLAMKMLKEKDE